MLGEEHPDTLTSMSNLAVTLGLRATWPAREDLKNRSLEVSRRMLGEEHPDTLISMNNLAATLGLKAIWRAPVAFKNKFSMSAAASLARSIPVPLPR